MLRALRNQTKSIFFKCFLVLLICGFALWGVGDLTGGSKGKSILSVENQKISLEEVLNEVNRARYMLSDRPTLEEAIKNGMHNKILNKFEQEMLINQEANHLSLNVPLSEQMKFIKKEKAFKDPLGKFSQNKFIQSLRNVGLSEEKYLEKIKTESNFNQLSMPFMLNDHYNKKIINKIIDWQNEIRDIEYKIFEMVNKKVIQKPSDETLQAFYKDNKKSYEIPLTRNIKYINLNPSHFEDQVVINKEQIDEKYEIEKFNYKTEETREILQIITQDEKKANEFMNLIKKGKKFNQIAKNNFNLNKSDTNIGYLKKSDLPLESADAVFGAKLNQILGPIKTNFGLSIYKIINILPPKQLNYEEVINDIKNKITKEKSIEILFEKLDVIEDLIAEGNNLEEITNSEVFNKKIAIKKLNKVSEQGLIFSYDNDTSFLKKNVQFLKNIWSTPENELSEIINSNDDNYYLIEVAKENKNEIPVYSLVKTKVYEQWLNNERILITKEKAKKSIMLNNNSLSLQKSIKRSDKFFDKIKDPYIINKIFEISSKDTEFLVSKDFLLVLRVKNSRTDDYVFNKKEYEELNHNFSKSFFNDFSNFYIQNLATKHKLKRNFQEIENYFNKTEVLN